MCFLCCRSDWLRILLWKKKCALLFRHHVTDSRSSCGPPCKKKKSFCVNWMAEFIFEVGPYARILQNTRTLVRKWPHWESMEAWEVAAAPKLKQTLNLQIQGAVRLLNVGALGALDLTAALTWGDLAPEHRPPRKFGSWKNYIACS